MAIPILHPPTLSLLDGVAETRRGARPKPPERARGAGRGPNAQRERANRHAPHPVVKSGGIDSPNQIVRKSSDNSVICEFANSVIISGNSSAIVSIAAGRCQSGYCQKRY